MIWHDVECGAYAADLPLWRELAAAARGPVLDVGAGTGRVAIDLARRGFDVHALDVDADLLAELRRREPGVPVHAADARDFDLGLRFSLVIAPMQTVQLLGGPRDREAFLRCARRHLAPGGVLAAALANTLEDFEAGEVEVPPDMREVDGVVYASRPTAVRADGDGFVLERLRERVDRHGARSVAENRIRLARVSAERLNAEGAAIGFHPEPPRTIEATDDHVGSEVAILRA
ncbi:MAG TPA: class I SAM-dependent methyltransferase [Solirubrobacteraceae bacterium]|nr:class I SAM-dependent methyltransferase [Solirubrobacteraceae bacterium]